MTPENSGTDVLLQADALMRRHRVFLAGEIEQVSTPVLEAISESPDDDLPVLTEVVTLDTAVASEATHKSEQTIAAHRQFLADELEKWLDEELPQVVLRVVDGFSDKLIAELVNEAHTALMPRLLETQTRGDET
jgi:hypothetical protein